MSADGPAPRVDRSMSLLVDMMTHTLDGAYVEAAERRAGAASRPAGAPPPAATSALRRLTVLGLLVALGALTGVAAAQVREREAAQDAGRSRLAADVRERTAVTDGLAATAQRLQSEVARSRGGALDADGRGRDVAARLALAELVAGTTAVTGAGLVVTLDDAESPEAGSAGERGGRPGDGRVLDRDLQVLVNGLWAAGAEAVSINGQRLSALTAIRGAGQAILVDKRPLVPPYAVQAIGDPAALEPRFVDGAAGRRLATFTSLYGLRFEVRVEDDLRLPATGEPDLRRAVPDPPAGSAP